MELERRGFEAHYHTNMSSLSNNESCFMFLLQMDYELCGFRWRKVSGVIAVMRLKERMKLLAPE